ncbi:SIMPL domain-containing protein [Flavobacterium amniphilum]|uniref:SIMPL domain-containing protein n=1 Tax=Flavobacterium amniphilum TaxID=1834035 RepID=UPI002029FC2E|nr:SIMPL domain-containing protein [Flavobacterium amniphilum]MCL9807523.1 SIMPL domain-containing protein [Flavobacterium amniphilum]
MKKIFSAILLLLITKSFSQNKNFIDQSYIETSAKIDTLVIPDKIYLTILISEKDTKGKISVDELETKMIEKLNSNGIDIKKQLVLIDLSSNFKKYFLKRQDIQKAKLYSLTVYNAKTAGSVIQSLEEENISNITLEKTEYSKTEKLKLELKSLAVKKAHANALSMAKPLNQKVGNAIFISDLDTNTINSLAGRVSGIQIRGASSIKESKYEYTSEDIEFEKIRISAEVGVKFKLENP